MRHSVTAASTWWRLNGVNLFSADLVSGLSLLGHDAELVLTRSGKNPLPMPAVPGLEPKTFAFPADLNLHEKRIFFKNYLESRGPCVYLPNHDIRYSCIAPLLSERVRTVGIIHSDDPFHYEHARRLGESWDAIVCVSRTIAEKARQLMPGYSERIHYIPYGIPAGQSETRPLKGPKLSLIYAGRLEQHQKNIFAIVNLLEALARENVNFHLTIAGDGLDRKRLERKIAEYIASGRVSFTGTLAREDLFKLYFRHDVFILLSAFEGLPLALLEAMARGCIPVVSHTASGIPEIICDGENGFILPKNEFVSMARVLSLIASRDTLRTRLSETARRTIIEGPYRVQNMLAAYESLFSTLWDRPPQRPEIKKILPPPLFPPGSWTRPWDTLRRAVRYAMPSSRPDAARASGSAGVNASV